MRNILISGDVSVYTKAIINLKVIYGRTFTYYKEQIQKKKVLAPLHTLMLRSHMQV